MPSYQYRKSHCGDKKILRPSYLYNGNPHTWKDHLYTETSPRLLPVPPWSSWALSGQARETFGLHLLLLLDGGHHVVGRGLEAARQTCRKMNLWICNVTMPAWDYYMYPGPWFNIRCHLTSIGNPIMEIRRSYDRLISTMGFPILVRYKLYIESGPWCLIFNSPSYL